MNIDKNKVYQLNLYANINPKILEPNNQTRQNKISKKNEKQSNDAINRIKMKSKVINGDQRRLQDRLTLIQSKEVHIEELENTLNYVKSKCIQENNNSNKEYKNIKIKIKKLTKKTKELEHIAEVDGKETGRYIEDKEKIILLINDTLNNINKVKQNLSQQKSKLMRLEESLKKSESKLESTKQQIECIKQEEILNPIDFIYIEGNIETGIIINIYA